MEFTFRRWNTSMERTLHGRPACRPAQDCRRLRTGPPDSPGAAVCLPARPCPPRCQAVESDVVLQRTAQDSRPRSALLDQTCSGRRAHLARLCHWQGRLHGPGKVSDATRSISEPISTLGCTLYKLLTGQAPFGSPQYTTHAEKLVGHLKGTPPPLRELRKDLSPNWLR